MINDTEPYVVFNRTAATSSGTSTNVDLGGGTLTGVFISTDAHKGTSLSFKTATASSGPWHNVLSSTGETVAITGISTQAIRYYAVNPTNFLGLRHLQIVSASTEEQVTYTLSTRPYI